MYLVNFEYQYRKQSARVQMAALFGHYIREYCDEIAEVLQVEMPSGVKDSTDKLAFVLGLLACGQENANGILSPARMVEDMVRDADSSGMPFTEDEKDAMAGYALFVAPFWSGFYESRKNVLWRLLMAGSDEWYMALRANLNGVRAALDAHHERYAKREQPAGTAAFMACDSEP